MRSFLSGQITPQGFVAKELLSAYLSAEADGFTGTDTGADTSNQPPVVRKNGARL